MGPDAQDLRELVLCYSLLPAEERARILALVRSLQAAQASLPPVQTSARPGLDWPRCRN